MSLPKYFLLYVLPLLFISATHSKTTVSPSTKTSVDWDKNKLEILTNIAEDTLLHTSNDITIVASQNIYNVDGSIKEIRTIELTIPNKGQHHKSIPDRRDYIEQLKKNDDDFEDTLMKMQKHFKDVYDQDGHNQETAYKKLTANGDIELEIYANKDEAFYQDDEGMGYYIQDNIKGNNKDKMEEDFKKRFQNRTNTLLSVLVWDSDGKFDSKQSMVDAKLMAYVDKASDNADEKMMDSAVEALSMYALNDPDRVAKELSAAMSKAYPDHTWYVTGWQEDNADNAKHDVYIKLTYDNARVGEDILEYTVYGVKK